MDAASARPNDAVSLIAKKTRGMVFLGTPFYGSPVAGWAEILRRMASIFWESNRLKIKDLEENSEKLKILAENFAKVLLQRVTNQTAIYVYFFNETRKSYGQMVRLALPMQWVFAYRS